MNKLTRFFRRNGRVPRTTANRKPAPGQARRVWAVEHAIQTCVGHTHLDGLR